MTREEAIKTIKALPVMRYAENSQKESDLTDALNLAITALKEPERKHGMWINYEKPDIDGNMSCTCSVCKAGDVHAKGKKIPYCWKCGAIMDGGTE